MLNNKNSQFALLHEIFILDAHLASPLVTQNRIEITNNFINEFLQILGLEPLGDLGVFDAADLRAPGWSFIQPITTSHISGHYFEKPGRQAHIRIDAYSCDAINWKNLLQVCDKHFSLSDWRANFIEREIEPAQNRRVLDLAGTGPIVFYEDDLISQKNQHNDELSSTQIKEACHAIS